MNAYREQYQAANHTAGSLDFFGAQETQFKKELDAAIGKLRDAKNEMGLLSIPVEQQAVQGQLSQIEAALLTNKASLASSEASSASLRKVVEKIPENLTTQQTTGFANGASDQMQQEYFKVLITLQEQESKLGNSHPLTEITRNQAQKLQKIVDKQATERKQTTVGVNSSRQLLEIDLRREEALVESYRAKVTTLSSQLTALQGRLKMVNEQEVRMSDLERDVSLCESKYRRSADHLEQARIGEALEDNRISNVNVVQPPTLVEQPISPKPLTIFGGALIALVGGSLGLVFASEYFDRSRRFLATVPRTVPDPRLSVPNYSAMHVPPVGSSL